MMQISLETIQTLLAGIGLLLVAVDITGSDDRLQSEADSLQEKESGFSVWIGWIITLATKGVIWLVAGVVAIILAQLLLPYQIKEPIGQFLLPTLNFLTPYVTGIEQIYQRYPLLFSVWPIGLLPFAYVVAVFKNYPKFLLSLIGAVTTIASYFIDYILPGLSSAPTGA